jgi:hypothetical protein
MELQILDVAISNAIVIVGEFVIGKLPIRTLGFVALRDNPVARSAAISHARSRRPRCGETSKCTVHDSQIRRRLHQHARCAAKNCDAREIDVVGPINVYQGTARAASQRDVFNADMLDAVDA